MTLSTTGETSRGQTRTPSDTTQSPEAGPGRVSPTTDADLRLSTAPGVDPTADVLEPLRAYVRGHATGDPSHLRAAFLPTAHVEGLRDGHFVSWDLDEFCERFPGAPAADEPSRRRRIEQVVVDGTVATAVMTLWHGPSTFTDAFLLVRADDGWRIANKAYHHRPGRGAPVAAA